MTRMVNLWIFVGSLLLFAGTFWQAYQAADAGVREMKPFLDAYNSLRDEQYQKQRPTRWREIFGTPKYVKARKAAENEASAALSEEEKELSRKFDRRGTAWAIMCTGSLIVCVGTFFPFWNDFANLAW